MAVVGVAVVASQLLYVIARFTAQRNLWERGNFMFSFYRVEPDRSGGVIPIDVSRRAVDPPVFTSARGVAFAAPTTSYCGHWLLDQEQLRAFVGDPSGQYARGGPNLFDMRENAAIGWHYDARPAAPGGAPSLAGSVVTRGGRADNESWEYSGRALVPLSADGSPHSLAAVPHMGQSYARREGWPHIHVEDIFRWTGPAVEYPAGGHPWHPCAAH